MLHSRDRRIEEAILQALSRAFQQELKDPRLPALFTITQVRISRDLKYAKAYYSQLPDAEADLAETAAMLKDCAGFLRSRVARQVNLKFCPELTFVHDAAPQRYQRISSVLEDLRSKGELEPGEVEDEPEEKPS